jgi:hypothetical protein
VVDGRFRDCRGRFHVRIVGRDLLMVYPLSRRGALIVEGRNMFIAFPPTFVFPSGLPKTFLPSHHIFYSQRLFDMKDGLPKYATHKEEGAPTMDESVNADRSKGRGEQTDKHEDKRQEMSMDQEEAEERSKEERNGGKSKRQKTK